MLKIKVFSAARQVKKRFMVIRRDCTTLDLTLNTRALELGIESINRASSRASQQFQFLLKDRFTIINPSIELPAISSPKSKNQRKSLRKGIQIFASNIIYAESKIRCHVVDSRSSRHIDIRRGNGRQ